MSKIAKWGTAGLMFFFGLGALSRILGDSDSPKLISGFLGMLSSLFTKTING